MNFAWTPEQDAIREAVGRVCARFDADDWLQKDRERGFPMDFHQAIFGYAKAYHVERYLREALLLCIAPISIQLIMCDIAEKVLGLPKSY